MQTTSTFPHDFSDIIQSLETLALRCTSQLLEASDGDNNPATNDPDLFGKMQRNLGGILRSLALVEKRAEKTKGNAARQEIETTPSPTAKTTKTAKSASPAKPKPATAQASPALGGIPQAPLTPSPFCGAPMDFEPPCSSSKTEPRLTKAQRRELKRARKKARVKQVKARFEKERRVQTSEQKQDLTCAKQSPPKIAAENGGTTPDLMQHFAPEPRNE